MVHAFAWLLLLAPLQAPAGAPPKAPAGPAPAAKPPAEPLDPNLAATALDSTLTFAELDELLIARRAAGPKGREVLKHLLDAKMLDKLAKESRLTITPAELDARAAELERQIVGSGAAKSLQQYLEKEGVALDVFREHLRLGMIQETLARRALGTPKGEEVNGEKQEMWLAQVLEQRGAQMPPPPWPDGVAARCGDLEVKVKDYLDYMRLLLPSEDVREDCFQLLLQKRIRARMPDLAPEALAKAIDAELARRRKEKEADPRYRGLTYEQIMAAQGVPAAYLRQDPAVVIASLSTLWVDRTTDDAGLRAVYAKEREFFDGLFGEAIDARMLFLRATELPNQLIPRDYAAAEKELATLKAGIKTAEEFGQLARKHSEENITREKEGRLGFIAKGDERLPLEVRDALFSAKPAADGTAVVGPVRLQGGVCLLWAGIRRPAPGWDEMSAHVHSELRRRFLESVMTREQMRTYLDRP